MKEQVVSANAKQIKSLQFTTLSPSEILQASTAEITTHDLYRIATDGKKREPASNGALDTRMGSAEKGRECETCGNEVATCVGHFGHIHLALPAFHIGYFRHIVSILQQICKRCSRILLTEPMRRDFLRELRRSDLDLLRRNAILRRLNEACRKMKNCVHCGALNGVVKKVGALKIIHDKFRSTVRAIIPFRLDFEASFQNAMTFAPDLSKHIAKATDDLNPLKTLNLFRAITPQDTELLGIGTRPEHFIWTYIPAPPVCIRPSVQQDGASNEDDLTAKLGEIANTSALIRAGLEKGLAITNIMELWDFLQLGIAMYINADLPGGIPSTQKPIRGLCQRLKGKQGRFRGNLSGKRVDFSGRTVISPDPNLAIDQVAVPVKVAMQLTYPERVTSYNIKRLRQAVKNGTEVWPGANYIVAREYGFKRFLKFGNSGDREDIAKRLRIGDVVERHLHDDDIVLFNRQPSLHRLSVLSHYVKVRPWRTFRLNECVCNPYNADFDGDEMNLHVPQTEESRAEARQLMGVKNNLVTPRNGEPIIAAIQDFILASYLITRKDSFFDRKTFTLLCASMCDANLAIDLPSPAVWKPTRLWTGKQLFSVLIRPNKESPVQLNLTAKCRSFTAADTDQDATMCADDGLLLIQNSVIISGVMDKSTIGEGKKTSLFYVTLRDFGVDHAVAAMNRLAKLCSRYLGNVGFSIGISDVRPGKQLSSLKDELVQFAYDKCDRIIADLKKGVLETQAGCDEEQTLEAKISGVLSKVRDDVGQICMSELSKNNAPLIMANSGSKGSKINVSQMVACVGQQIISGSRVPDGFQDRTLPHFPKNSKQPPSKGFVRSSFFSGLSPTEFLFHAISGREGLVDTAVKTAETGYMSRRLMKSLEDLSVKYDGTVRNSAGGIIQFQYGGDKLDPMDMEGDAVPVNFERTWNHCHNVLQAQSPLRCSGLLPWQIIEVADAKLKPHEAPIFGGSDVRRVVNSAGDASVLNKSEDAVEGARREAHSDNVGFECQAEMTFYESIRQYIFDQAYKLSQLRKSFNMPASLKKNDIKAEDEEMADAASVAAVGMIMSIDASQIDLFLNMCIRKYLRAQIEPGTAVGAIAAQSIGEPGTQMTLKTFHFAGVASMNVTLGVPRIKEIINASKTISTPIITCTLINEDDERAARVVKGRLEKTFLSDVISWLDEVYCEDKCYIAMKLNFDTINKLQLALTLNGVVDALVAAPKLKLQREQFQLLPPDKIRLMITSASSFKKPATPEPMSLYYRVQHLTRALPSTIVLGYPSIHRAVISEANGKKKLLVEGYGLREAMNTVGVVGERTTSNHIMETNEVLGIEAARSSIIREINYTMSSHGMNIDPRHVALLGDIMTFKGEVLGITRFGVAKMKDSVLSLASFEKTTDHLFDAGFYHKKDTIDGVSEKIILGQVMAMGTGSFQIVRPTGLSEMALKPTLFEDTLERLSA